MVRTISLCLPTRLANSIRRISFLKLLVQRAQPDSFSTPGELSVDGIFECFTLEPSPSNLKFPLIPAGTYRVLLLPSIRFEQMTPHIESVPGRSFIEIHPGNRAQDTHGCLLVGESRSTDWVGSSRAAFESLMTLLRTEPENLSITYQDFQEEPNVS